MPASDITGNDGSYRGMIISQINRLLWLVTLGNAKYQGQNEMFSRENLALASLRGILILEALMKPLIDDDDDYAKNTEQVKTDLLGNLKNITNQEINYYDNYAMLLEALVMKLDKLSLLPQEEIEIEYD